MINGPIDDWCFFVGTQYFFYIITNIASNVIISTRFMPLGIIGPETSEEMEVMGILGHVSPNKRILQVGVTSLSSSLSNKSRFPNLVTLVVPDEDYIEVCICFNISFFCLRVL